MFRSINQNVILFYLDFLKFKQPLKLTSKILQFFCENISRNFTYVMLMFRLPLPIDMYRCNIMIYISVLNDIIY